MKVCTAVIFVFTSRGMAFTYPVEDSCRSYCIHPAVTGTKLRKARERGRRRGALGSGSKEKTRFEESKGPSAVRCLY